MERLRRRRDDEPAAVAEAPRVAAPTVQRLLDLQAGAGNQAVARGLTDARIGVTTELLELLGAPAATRGGEPGLPSEHSAYEFKPVAGEAFVQGAGDAGKVDPNDVDQNQLGDCYLMAALAAVARANPAAIERLIKDNGDGTYDVTIYEDEGWFSKDLQPKVVKVTATFPTMAGGGIPYAGKGDTGPKGPELWVMLIEKAWAQNKGGYSVLNEGGYAEAAMEGITGRASSQLEVEDYSDAELAKKLAAALAAKKAVTTSSKGTKKKMDEHKIVGGHEYAVRAVDTAALEIDLQNPWGPHGDIKLAMSVFRQFFDDVSINPAK